MRTATARPGAGRAGLAASPCSTGGAFELFDRDRDTGGGGGSGADEAAKDGLEHASSSPASPVGNPEMRASCGDGAGSFTKPAVPRREACMSCVDCHQTPRSVRGRDVLECTSPRCNTLATALDEGPSTCGGNDSSGLTRNRLCIRCLTEQHGYSPAELQQDLFTCPYCRERTSGARASAEHTESDMANRCDSVSRKRSRSHNDRPVLTSGKDRSQQPMPIPMEPHSTRPDDADVPEQDQPHQGASKRPKTVHDNATQDTHAGAACGGVARPGSHTTAQQPPYTKPTDSLLRALRSFLDDAAGDQPGTQCRITVGAVISALAKCDGSVPSRSTRGAMRTTAATAMSGLEYLRRTKEISIDVNVEAVEVASVASVLRIGLLNLNVCRSKMSEGDRVMVKGPGNLWIPAQVISVREADCEKQMLTTTTTGSTGSTGSMSLADSANASQLHSQSLALLRYDGLGSAWDEWRAAEYSKNIAKLSNADDNDLSSSYLRATAATSFGWDADNDGTSHDALFTSDEEDDDQEVDVCMERSASPAALRTSVKGDNGDLTATDDDPKSTELEARASKGIPSAEATAAEGSAALAAAAAELPYQVGTILEALDVASKWFAARVVKVDLRKFGNQPRNKRLRIHFIGWGTEWDEWFDLNDPMQPARLRPLSPTTEFGPYFHTVGQVGMWKAGFASDTFRNRMRYVLEATGNGQKIGFDSLVRAVYEFRSRMRPDDAMKIVRRVAKVLEEWHEQCIVRWTSPIGFVEVIDITKSNRSSSSPILPPVSTPLDGDAIQTSDDMQVTVSDPVAPPPSTNSTLAAPTFKVGDAVEVLDGTMDWFMATIIELPTETHRAPDNSDGNSNGSPRPSLQVVSVIESNVGYAKCRFDGWSAEWDIWVPASTASGDLPRIRHKTSAAKKKEHVAAAGGGTLMAAGVEATGADMFDESDESFYSAECAPGLSAAAKDLEFSTDQRDATFREVANIVFSSPEVEARMRRVTRQTKKTDVEAIGTTRAEDVPIEVMDTHTIKNLGAFARHDIAEGAFIGEYAGEVTLLSSVRKRKSEYLFNLGSGLTIDASRQGNATRFMNHSSDDYACNVNAMIVNHRGTRRVVFHAKRLIHHGEEMMYDYGEDFANNIGKRLI